MQGYNGSINTVQAVEVMKSKLTLWDASAVLLAVPVALPVLAILISFLGEVATPLAIWPRRYCLIICSILSY